MYIHQNTV